MKIPTERLFKVFLIVLALTCTALPSANCGGGGGGSTPAVAEKEYASLVMLAPAAPINAGTANITTQGTTASGNTVQCRITDFGDGSQNQTQWFDCNASGGVSFTHTYANATANNVVKTITVEANNGQNVTTKNFQLTILPASTSGAGGLTSPNLTGLSCEADTIISGQSLACSSTGTCPAGGTCYLYVDYGDGNSGTFAGVNVNNISHTYAAPPANNDVTYTIQVYATNGLGGPQSTTIPHNVRVRTGSLTAPEAMKLSTSLDFAQVGNDPYHFRIGTICSSSSCNLSGTLSTNTNKAFVKTAAGQETEITVNKSNWTWSYSVQVADAEEAIKSFVFWAEDVSENESPHITVDYKVDRKKPDVPTVNPVTSPTTTSSQTISGTKPKCAAVWRGTTQIAAITDEDDCNRIDSWSEVVNFNSYSTYSYGYFSKDKAGNQSNTVTVQIQYTNNNGGGGGGGGGTTDPNAPTISCSHSVNGLTLTATCSVSGSGCTSASMSWGDSSAAVTISCSGSTIGHTYSSSSSYTYTATVNSSSGSNTYSRTVNLASGGGTNYALIGSCTIANAVSLTGNGVDTLYSLTSGGEVRRYDLNCGNEKVMTYVNRPEGFAKAVAIAYSPGNNRIAIVDRDGNKIFIFDISGDNLNWNRTIGDDTVFSAPDALAFDNVGYSYVVDRGNQALKRFNAAGVQQCAYTSWSAASTGMGITVDNSSPANIYTTNQGADSVEKFNTSCAKVTSMATGGINTQTPVNNPVALAVIPTGGELWIGDDGHSRIVVINPLTKTDMGIVAPSGNPIGMTIINGDLYALIGGTTVEHYGSQ